MLYFWFSVFRQPSALRRRTTRDLDRSRSPLSESTLLTVVAQILAEIQATPWRSYYLCEVDCCYCCFVRVAAVVSSWLLLLLLLCCCCVVVCFFSNQVSALNKIAGSHNPSPSATYEHMQQRQANAYQQQSRYPSTRVAEPQLQTTDACLSNRAVASSY